MSRWGDGGCFLRDAGVREITPLISHRCIPSQYEVSIWITVMSSIEVNIWVTIMSSFIKRNCQNKVNNIANSTVTCFFFSS